MSPVRRYSNWNLRNTDNMDQQEPYKKYFFICEGVNTETFYFRKLIDIKKQLKIHQSIEICLLEKTKEDRNISYPLYLMQFAIKQKDNPDLNFDKNHDKMILVFDLDIFEKKVDNFDRLLKLSKQNGDILAVTNPSFELFLLLHFKNNYDEIIHPNWDNILLNQKKGNQTYIYRLLLEKCGINCKKNHKIGDLAFDIEEAIAQEKYLNQNVEIAIGNVTSTVAKVIDDIRKESILI